MRHQANGYLTLRDAGCECVGPCFQFTDLVWKNCVVLTIRQGSITILLH